MQLEEIQINHILRCMDGEYTKLWLPTPSFGYI